MARNWKLAVFTLAIAAACAKGGAPGETGDDDDDLPRDARSMMDAPTLVDDAPRPPIDAPVPPIDAPVPPPDAPPDAPPALFCSSNAECTVAGECCIRVGTPVGVCGPGIPIGSQCVPQ